MDSNGIEDRLIDIEEASVYLGLAVGTLYNKVSRKEIPCSRVGRAIRFRKSVLDAWVKESPAVEPAVAEGAAL